MKLPVVVLCCVLLVIASTEARRKKRARTPRLRLTANPTVVVDGFSPDLTVDCKVSNGGGGVMPIYLLLQRKNENGTVNMGLQMMDQTTVMAIDNRTEASGAIASGDGEESSLTFTISQPGEYDEGEYVCHYMYLTPEVNTITASANVTVEFLPEGEEYVPPPPAATGPCCDEALEEIEKLKDALANQGSGAAAAPVAADASCQASFSAGLREETGYVLRPLNTIVFDTIISNKGAAYDASSGKFTAPCTGQYYFSLTLSALHSTSGTVEGVIRRGTKNQARTFAFTPGYDEQTSASTSVLLTLQEGEEVDVQLEASSDGEYVGGEKTIFSGYYLFP